MTGSIPALNVPEICITFSFFLGFSVFRGNFVDYAVAYILAKKHLSPYTLPLFNATSLALSFLNLWPVSLYSRSASAAPFSFCCNYNTLKLDFTYYNYKTIIQGLIFKWMQQYQIRLI